MLSSNRSLIQWYYSTTQPTDDAFYLSTAFSSRRHLVVDSNFSSSVEALKNSNNIYSQSRSNCSTVKLTSHLSCNKSCQFAFFESKFKKSGFKRNCLAKKFFGFDSEFGFILDLSEKSLFG